MRRRAKTSPPWRVTRPPRACFVVGDEGARSRLETRGCRVFLRGVQRAFRGGERFPRVGGGGGEAPRLISRGDGGVLGRETRACRVRLDAFDIFRAAVFVSREGVVRGGGDDVRFASFDAFVGGGDGGVGVRGGASGGGGARRRLLR